MSDLVFVKKYVIIEGKPTVIIRPQAINTFEIRLVANKS
jgi:hypothetical protein